MKECVMQSQVFAVGAGSYVGFRPPAYESRTVCMTHGVPMESVATVTAPTRCVVGLIEDAVDAGVARIEALLQKQEPRCE